MKKTLLVGVTGGIGSGKTTVCRIFNVLGIPVFSADNEARIIMDSDPAVIDKINLITGKDMYSSGLLDRVEMARMIFHDRNLLDEINKLIHPLVIDRFLNWVPDQEAPYVILEAAILFESGAADILDRNITVIAPAEERIERVVRRNNLTREQVVERIENQSSDSFKTDRSDYVINNSDNFMIIPHVLQIHKELLELADRT